MAQLELKPQAGKSYTRDDMIRAGETFAPLRVTVGLRGGSLLLFGEADTLRGIAEQLHQAHRQRHG